jgi:hypothetical protein
VADGKQSRSPRHRVRDISEAEREGAELDDRPRDECGTPLTPKYGESPESIPEGCKHKAAQPPKPQPRLTAECAHRDQNDICVQYHFKPEEN